MSLWVVRGAKLGLGRGQLEELISSHNCFLAFLEFCFVFLFSFCIYFCFFPLLLARLHALTCVRAPLSYKLRTNTGREHYELGRMHHWCDYCSGQKEIRYWPVFHLVLINEKIKNLMTKRDVFSPVTISHCAHFNLTPIITMLVLSCLMLSLISYPFFTNNELQTMTDCRK